MSSLGGWSSLKSEATTLESYIEKRLHNNTTSAIPSSSTLSDVESGLDQQSPAAVRLNEIEESLTKLTSVIERLGAAATASTLSANAAIAQVSYSLRERARSGQARGGQARGVA